MRRKRLSALHVQSSWPDKTRQALHPQLHRATGGCGVNALSALHVLPVGRIRRDKRRIRHLHRATADAA